MWWVGYKLFMVLILCQIHKKPLSQVKWMVFTDGWVKINVDGATHQEHLRGGVGAMIKDWTGQFLTARAWCKAGIRSALYAELVAMLKGVRLVRMLGYGRWLWSLIPL